MMNPASREVIAAGDDERRDLFLTTAERLGPAVQNVEKDFRVCWTETLADERHGYVRRDRRRGRAHEGPLRRVLREAQFPRARIRLRTRGVGDDARVRP